MSSWLYLNRNVGPRSYKDLMIAITARYASPNMMVLDVPSVMLFSAFCLPATSPLASAAWAARM